MVNKWININYGRMNKRREYYDCPPKKKIFLPVCPINILNLRLCMHVCINLTINRNAEKEATQRLMIRIIRKKQQDIQNKEDFFNFLIVS